MSHPISLPVHPDQRLATSKLIGGEVKKHGFEEVRATRLATMIAGSGGADDLQARIARNLGAAFEARELESLVKLEIFAALDATGSPATTSGGIPLPPPKPPPQVPGIPPLPGAGTGVPGASHDFPSDAPGAQELFDNPLAYRDFIEWMAEFWGIDEFEAKFGSMSDEMYDASVAWYDYWLGFHIEAQSTLEEFMDFLSEIGMTVAELQAALSETFTKGGTSLDTLLNSLGKWFFNQFGLSP
jgi:hypothetical protein